MNTKDLLLQAIDAMIDRDNLLLALLGTLPPKEQLAYLHVVQESMAITKKIINELKK